jgi:glutathione S-transferase
MTDRGNAEYRLFYWPHIPGRGEFVRLVLEAAGADYIDVARLPEDQGGGAEAVGKFLADIDGPPAYAPPVLEHDDLVISQTSNICAYLARRHSLVPDDQRARLHANQLQLTMQDLLGEAHDTHHPIAIGQYYKEQKDAAARRAEGFVENRMPKFFDYFERAARQGSSTPHLIGDELTYVDLSMFHMLRGLAYAFPNAFADRESSIPTLLDLADEVAGRERIAAYLDSDRRIAFNEQGIFRHYPELDLSRG